MANEQEPALRVELPRDLASSPVSTPVAPKSCTACGGADGSARPVSAMSTFVYALGRLEPRFPSLSVEKEFAQAVGRAQTANLTDRQATHAALSKPENAYLVRHLCWVFSVEGIDSYVVVPPGSEEARYLVQAIRSSPRTSDVDVLIGTVGPPVSGRACNGLTLPSVNLAQLYTFDVEELVRKLPRPKDVSDPVFAATVQEVLNSVLQLADNAGLRSDHRALNYLATRDPSIYSAVAHRFQHNESLVSVDVRPSPLSTSREVKEVVLTFRHRETDAMQRLFARVDTTELFPFLVTKLSPYTER
jgi:hypothetical protein